MPRHSICMVAVLRASLAMHERPSFQDLARIVDHLGCMSYSADE